MPPLAGTRRFARMVTIAWVGGALGAILGVTAADWPQWRGPDRTGHPAPTEPTLTHLPASPRVVWSMAAGPGYASPVVAGGQVFALEAQEGREVLRALDAATGTERWKSVLDETFTDSQGPAAPRCTPVVFDGRVYVQSCRGRLTCMSAADGKTVWSVDYTRDFGATFVGEKGNAQGAMRHGNNGAPWVEAGWVWASAGSTNGAGMVALDPKTGALRWKGGHEVAGYAAPMVGTLLGVRQVVNFMADAVVGFEGVLPRRRPVDGLRGLELQGGRAKLLVPGPCRRPHRRTRSTARGGVHRRRRRKGPLDPVGLDHERGRQIPRRIHCGRRPIGAHAERQRRTHPLRCRRRDVP
ncbi:MAG: hypothetical protein EBU81_04980 [Proteobacteria bacterium]|nr:hypothetical protein [Pseudomonadota bacterium]